MTGSGPRVAVAGAGPAGMAAAFRLARAGARVVVFEAASALGGRTRTADVGGVRVDVAAQLFGSPYRRFLGLLGEAGGSELLVRTSGRDALWRGGRAHEVVYGSPTSMLASGALPFGLKLKLGAVYLPFLHRHAAALEMDALERAARAGLDRESAAAWGMREMGRDFVDLLAHPLLATLYGSGADETSSGFYHALARQGMSLEVLALRRGASAFCDLLARAVSMREGEVRTSTPVRSVEADAAGVEVSGDGWAERFDAAVVAVPAPAARAIAGNGMPAMAAWLEGVSVRPTVTMALVADRPLGTSWFGLSYARGESRAVAAACVQEAKETALVPHGMGALLALPLPDVGPRLMDATPEQVLHALLPDLLKPFPRLESHLRAAEVFRWEHGWTVFRPGFLEHLSRARGGALEADRRVAFAGDYLHAPNVEGAVATGLGAADRILAALRMLPG